MLNLSSNLVESISSYFLNQLFKLETVDLSCNKIRFLNNFSFNKLLNLRNLHLNENDPNLKLSVLSFQQLESIQNVYLNKDLFYKDKNDLNSIFLNIFKFKNSKFSKTVLKRTYYKSLFLITPYEAYDCDLTLFFIRENIHLNFKSESNIFDYFSGCSQNVIKNSLNDLRLVFLIANKNANIFKNVLFYLCCLTLLLILILAICLCSKN